jgi:hypothetical protein
MSYHLARSEHPLPQYRNYGTVLLQAVHIAAQGEARVRLARFTLPAEPHTSAVNKGAVGANIGKLSARTTICSRACNPGQPIAVCRPIRLSLTSCSSLDQLDAHHGEEVRSPQQQSVEHSKEGVTLKRCARLHTTDSTCQARFASRGR